MAMSVTRRPGRVLVARSVHPDYRQILATYLANLDVELVTLDTPGGTLDPETLRAAVNDKTACLLLATAQLLRLRGEDRNAGQDRSRGRRVAGRQRRSDQPRPAQAAGRRGGRYRRGGRAIAGHADAIRGAVPGHPRLPRAVPPPHARPPGRPDRRSSRPTVLGVDACKPASSTSAATGPRATSARTRPCWPFVRRSTWPPWVPPAWPTWRTSACRRPIMRPSV